MMGEGYRLLPWWFSADIFKLGPTLLACGLSVLLEHSHILIAHVCSLLQQRN